MIKSEPHHASRGKWSQKRGSAIEHALFRFRGFKCFGNLMFYFSENGCRNCLAMAIENLERPFLLHSGRFCRAFLFSRASLASAIPVRVKIQGKPNKVP